MNTLKAKLTVPEHDRVKKAIPPAAKETQCEAPDFLVDDLQPLDHSLPSTVMSVMSHPHGKAKEAHVQHLRNVKQGCARSGFFTVAFCSDGDSASSSLTNPIYRSIHRAEDASFGDFVKAMEEGAHPELFVRDFLHEMKCLQNRMADHRSTGDISGCHCMPFLS
jgi:hypothetical protein